MNSKILAQRITTFIGLLLIGVCAVFYINYRCAKLDIKKTDDLLTLEKNVGFHPASGEVYVDTVGFMDPTVFYKARVSEKETQWLESIPRVSRFDAPNHAPLWWALSLWWSGRDKDMRYYRTNAKWPCVFAYSPKTGWVYGTVEYE